MKVRQSTLFIGAPLAQTGCADDEVRLKGKALAQNVRQSASPIGAPLAHVGQKRHKPRKGRRPYHDTIWQAALIRTWAARLGHPDLDKLFTDTLKEMPMQNDVELELTIRGRDRTLCLPRCALTNIAPALERLAWFKQTAAVDQRIAKQAEAVLEAIGKAATP